MLLVNWEGLPPLQVDLPAQDPHPALGTLVASLLAGRNPRRTDVVLLGSPDSTPALLRDLPNLAGRVVHPAERRALRPALHRIGAVGGANLAGRGLGGEQGLVVVCEVTELDRPTLATLTRLAHLGSRTGVQVVLASARPWPLVVDHCPLALLAMLTCRLSLGERRRPAWCLWAELDDWRFGDLSLLTVPTGSLARLDQAYAPPKPPAPGAPRPASA